MRFFVFLIFGVLFAVSLGSGAAYAQPLSGTTGTVQSTPAAPPTLPPVFNQTPPTPEAAVPPAAEPVTSAPPTTTATPEVSPVPAAGVDPATLPVDPCAAYLGSYNAYVVCQDRIKRLDRMKQVKEKRIAEEAARRQAIADRKAAEQEPTQRKSGFRRPGEVMPAPKQPQQVQIVPSTDTAQPAGSTAP